MSISSIIDSIRKRPGIYLGSNSITALMHFLNGYQAAQSELSGCHTQGYPGLFPLDFSFMHEFVKLRLEHSDNSGWCRNLLNEYGGNEESALQAFFELYNEFRQIHMKQYQKSALSDSNISFNDKMEHAYRMRDGQKAPLFSSPVSVYVIELSIPAYMLIVECADVVKICRELFPTSESAKRAARMSLGAEGYFGKIDSWEEPSTYTLEFGSKPFDFC